MRIYLDNCALNRPYDDLTQMTVALEARTKLKIQADIKAGKYELVTSEILNLEVTDNPYEMRRKNIRTFIEENSSFHISENQNESVWELADEIMKTGIKFKDACHAASALIGECEYLISTDHRFLKYRNDNLKMVDPIEFIRDMEDEDYGRE